MSKKIINALKINSGGDFKIDPEKEKLIEISALLHDIGHGPFSHIFEGVVKNLGGNFDHEEMSIKIILECKEINNILRNQFGSNFPEQIAQVLKKEYPDINVVSVISSQFDADRIDYLLRDSYMTGANYGRFDVDWLLMNISIANQTFYQAMEGQAVIAVNYKKGLNVLEQYILGRHYMYSHVYFHKAIRSFEAIINKIIERVIKEEHKSLVGYRFIERLLNGEMDLDEYLLLDDFLLQSWFTFWKTQTKDEVLLRLLDDFLCRKPFKAIIAPQDRTSYMQSREKILSLYNNDVERNYFFFEDSQKNVAYKDLYATKDILEEIFVRKEQDVIPLSAVNESIISSSRNTLRKETIRWYVASDVYSRYCEEG
ncbi:MAG: HD domain-containing protein [Peptococcaceae bacterium]|nr:HD domain-containing protein [Peptococcaceae bacterium]